MKAKLMLVACLLFLIFTGCTAKSEENAGDVVTAFYKSYQGDFRTADKGLLTQDLSGLIAKAVAKEKFAAYEKDKTLVIDKDLFTGSGKGEDSFKIIDIQAKGSKATVIIEFTNVNDNTIWKDEMLLVKEKKWKIDNVLFKGEKANGNNTKLILNRFINS
jgi:hypothetical protein